MEIKDFLIKKAETEQELTELIYSKLMVFYAETGVIPTGANIQLDGVLETGNSNPIRFLVSTKIETGLG